MKSHRQIEREFNRKAKRGKKFLAGSALPAEPTPLPQPSGITPNIPPKSKEFWAQERKEFLGLTEHEEEQKGIARLTRAQLRTPKEKRALSQKSVAARKRRAIRQLLDAIRRDLLSYDDALLVDFAAGLSLEDTAARVEKIIPIARDLRVRLRKILVEIKSAEMAKFVPVSQILKFSDAKVSIQQLEAMCERPEVVELLAQRIPPETRPATKAEKRVAANRFRNHEITQEEFSQSRIVTTPPQWATRGDYFAHLKQFDTQAWRRELLIFLAANRIVAEAPQGTDEFDRDPSNQSGTPGKRHLQSGGADFGADGVGGGWRGDFKNKAFIQKGPKMLHYGLDSGDPYSPDDGSGDPGKGTTPAHDDYGEDSGA